MHFSLSGLRSCGYGPFLLSLSSMELAGSPRSPPLSPSTNSLALATGSWEDSKPLWDLPWGEKKNIINNINNKQNKIDGKITSYMYKINVTGSEKRYIVAHTMIFLYKRCCSETRNIFYSLKKKIFFLA